MDYPFIDYNVISSDISNKCYQLLQNIDVNTVSDAFDAVKEIVEIAVEKYSFKVSEYWMENHLTVETARKINFTDVDNGYEILLKKWVDQNPFKAELPECPEVFSESFDDYVAKLKKNALAIGAVGTAIIGTTYAVSTSHIATQATVGATCAKGWLIFGNPIVAIAAELIGLALLYATIKQKRDAKKQDIEQHVHELEMKLNNYKKNLVETLTLSANIWLKNAETYSNNIIKTF